MALARRSDNRTQMAWPGFVDAMTALLLVLMFVLSIFMIVQFTLRETISGNERRLSQLTAQLAELSNVLAMEEARSEDLTSRVASLSATLDEGRAENLRLEGIVSTLTAERDALSARAARFEDQIASLLAERDRMVGEIAAAEEGARERRGEITQLRARISSLEAAETRAISEREALQLTLARLRDEISAETEAARLAAAQADAMEALVASLRAEKAETERTSAELSGRLDDAERRRLLEAAAAEELRKRLSDATAELSAMSLILDQERRKAEQTLEMLAAAEAAKSDLESELADVRDIIDREKALQLVAQRQLADAEQVNTEQARQLAALNAQTRALREQIAAVQAQLEASEAKESEANVEIASLGQRLNAALAREAAVQRREAEIQRREAELQRLEAERLRQENQNLAAYRSEFFGRMREVLSGRSDIRIVGDRFLFQSEVLFDVGSAELGAAGRAELQRLAQAIREVMPEIPEGIDWVLRVDGHTDVTGSVEFNWELSQRRALSVVRYLAESEGLPWDRLVAAGFGQFQPLDRGTSAEALGRNRRIEVKFTER